MKRDFLKELGLDADVIDKIMAENGNDINKAKAESEKLNAELEQVKSDLTKANDTLEKFKDYDNVKADVEKYKAEYEKSKADYEQKINTIERQSRIKEFTGSKQFVNDFTRDSINKMIDDEMQKKENKDKSIEDLFKALTDGKNDILKNVSAPTPPKMANMADTKDDGSNEDKVRAIMGLPPLKA